jgi:hypothetical protein
VAIIVLDDPASSSRVVASPTFGLITDAAGLVIGVSPRSVIGLLGIAVGSVERPIREDASVGL